MAQVPESRDTKAILEVATEDSETAGAVQQGVKVQVRSPTCSPEVGRGTSLSGLSRQTHGVCSGHVPSRVSQGSNWIVRGGKAGD